MWRRALFADVSSCVSDNRRRFAGTRPCSLHAGKVGPHRPSASNVTAGTADTFLAGPPLHGTRCPQKLSEFLSYATDLRRGPGALALGPSSLRIFFCHFFDNFLFSLPEPLSFIEANIDTSDAHGWFLRGFLSKEGRQTSALCSPKNGN